MAAALPTFIMTYPDTHPHAAPIPICFGAGAFDASFTNFLKVVSVSRLNSEKKVYGLEDKMKKLNTMKSLIRLCFCTVRND